jgi:hypothetical protein
MCPSGCSTATMSSAPLRVDCNPHIKAHGPASTALRPERGQLTGFTEVSQDPAMRPPITRNAAYIPKLLRSSSPFQRAASPVSLQSAAKRVRPSGFNRPSVGAGGIDSGRASLPFDPMAEELGASLPLDQSGPGNLIEEAASREGASSPVSTVSRQALPAGRPRSSSVDKGREPHSQSDSGVFKRIRVGVCAMDKKARSKPMTQILSRLPSSEFEVIIFGNSRLLEEDPEDWPIVDCLIAFFSKGFPLNKAELYVKLRKPFCVNDLRMEHVLRDRRAFYAHLVSNGVPVPPHIVVSRDYGRKQHIVEYEDALEVDGDIIHKPFVEKPVDAEDHNIIIYFPRRMGGGCKVLFRKVGNRSSEFYPDVNRVRTTGSYIYEEFLQTSGTDLKCYAVGPDYTHAEARKSPVVDGIVQRDSVGKELRFPIMLTPHEKELARRVVLAFRMNVCGLDLLRTHNRTYVCDVNGWSFVKTSTKYYDDAAQLLTFMMLRARAPHRLRARALAAFSAPAGLPSKMPNADEPLRSRAVAPHRARGDSFSYRTVSPTESDGVETSTFAEAEPVAMDPAKKPSPEELRCVIAVIRHGDRTPKQKMKVKVTHPKLLALHRRFARGPHHEAVLKSAGQLQRLLETSRELLESEDVRADQELFDKLQQLRSVLERGGRFHGINRKVQIKPSAWKSRNGDLSEGSSGWQGSEPALGGESASGGGETSADVLFPERKEVARPRTTRPRIPSYSQPLEDDNDPTSAVRRFAHMDTPHSQSRTPLVTASAGGFDAAGMLGQPLNEQFPDDEARAAGASPSHSMTSSKAALASSFPPPPQLASPPRVRVVIGRPPWERKADSEEEDDTGRAADEWDEEVVEATLVLKWGGVLTEYGRKQAAELGRRFRSNLFPGESTGLLRLHATYRHDLKLYSSMEGRVQMTAAAFTKSFLALDGELTPILASLVRNANTQALLDDSGGARESMEMMKESLREGLLTDPDADELASLSSDGEELEIALPAWAGPLGQNPTNVGDFQDDDELDERAGDEDKDPADDDEDSPKGPTPLSRPPIAPVVRMTSSSDLLMASPMNRPVLENLDTIVELKLPTTLEARMREDRHSLALADPILRVIAPDGTISQEKALSFLRHRPLTSLRVLHEAVQALAKHLEARLDEERAREPAPPAKADAPTPPPAEMELLPRSAEVTLLQEPTLDELERAVSVPGESEHSLPKILWHRRPTTVVGSTGSSVMLTLERWRKLARDMFNRKKERFDLSKLPDVYDCIKHDILHSLHIRTAPMQVVFRVYLISRAFADIVIPQEYGITFRDKHEIGSSIAHHLLRKIFFDLTAMHSDESPQEVYSDLTDKHRAAALQEDRLAAAIEASRERRAASHALLSPSVEAAADPALGGSTVESSTDREGVRSPSASSIAVPALPPSPKSDREGVRRFHGADRLSTSFDAAVDEAAPLVAAVSTQRSRRGSSHVLRTGTRRARSRSCTGLVEGIGVALGGRLNSSDHRDVFFPATADQSTFPSDRMTEQDETSMRDQKRSDAFRMAEASLARSRFTSGPASVAPPRPPRFQRTSAAPRAPSQPARSGLVVSSTAHVSGVARVARDDTEMGTFATSTVANGTLDDLVPGSPVFSALASEFAPPMDVRGVSGGDDAKLAAARIGRTQSGRVFPGGGGRVSGFEYLPAHEQGAPNPSEPVTGGGLPGSMSHPALDSLDSHQVEWIPSMIVRQASTTYHDHTSGDGSAAEGSGQPVGGFGSVPEMGLGTDWQPMTLHPPDDSRITETKSSIEGNGPFLVGRPESMLRVEELQRRRAEQREEVDLAVADVVLVSPSRQRALSREERSPDESVHASPIRPATTLPALEQLSQEDTVPPLGGGGGGGGETHRRRRQVAQPGSLQGMDREFSEAVHKLDSASMTGAGYTAVKSPQRHVRTRLYFTSESHVHALVNVLRCAPLVEGIEHIMTDQGRLLLEATPELDYTTHIVIRLYERMDVPASSPQRHRVELLFSPGASVDPMTSAPRAPIRLPAERLYQSPLASPSHKSPRLNSTRPTTADEAVAATAASFPPGTQEPSCDPPFTHQKSGKEFDSDDRPLRYIPPLPMVPLTTNASLHQLEELLALAVLRSSDLVPSMTGKVKQKTPMDMADASLLFAAAQGALQ